MKSILKVKVNNLLSSSNSYTPIINSDTVIKLDNKIKFDPIFLLILKYLSEFKTEEQKAKARENLGVLSNVNVQEIINKAISDLKGDVSIDYDTLLKIEKIIKEQEVHIQDNHTYVQEELNKFPDTVVSGLLDNILYEDRVLLKYGINKRSTNTRYTGARDILAATLEKAGVMSALDKVNLDVTIPNLINTHINNKTNPHEVTKSLVGLGNVLNEELVRKSEKGVANGVATLNEQGLVPLSQLPSYVDDVIDCYATYNKAEDGALTNIRLYLDLQHQNAISGESGKIYVDITNSELITSSAYQFRWTGTQFAVVGAPTVIGEVTGTAFDGKRGKDLEDKTNAHIGNTSNPHNVTKALIGLLNVDNTSDANKPISNATQSALDNKQNTLVSGTNIKTLNGESLLGSGNILIQSGGVGKVDPNSGGTGEIFNDYRNNKATGQYSHAEGLRTTASGYCSHAEGTCSGGGGYYITASGDGSHAEGYVSIATGGIKASGRGAHAEGYINLGSTYHMHAEGDGSHIQNIGTVAKNYGQTSMGCFNEDDKTPKPTSYDASKPALIIGNGTSDAAGNAFKVLFNGKTFADGEYSSAGADYAEMFEWKDRNPLNEDRVGRFVTLKGKNIEIADETSTYILGIVSGAPTIIGDNPMRWQGKYLNDEWGRPIYEDIEVTYTEYERQVDGTFKEVEKTRIDRIRKLNPLYNSQEKYIPRENRKEWDAVGLFGKLLVKQDGTLEVGKFCKPNEHGIATISDSGYYVMEIISNRIAKILFK